MNRKFTRPTALLVSIILILTTALGSTLAYVVTRTPALINTFINGIDPTGDLILEKAVKHPFGETYDVSVKSFTFEVNLGSAYGGKTFGIYTANENGVMEVTVPGGGAVTIPELPAGIDVLVTELAPGPGFKAPDPTALTIQRGENKLRIENEYDPAPADTNKLNVSGTKKLVGRDWQAGDRFVFALEVFLGDDQWKELDRQTVEYSAADENFNTFDFTEAVRAYTMDQPGDYVFRVVEKEGSIPGITYDTNESRFVVSVGDSKNAMDGTLKLENVTTSSPDNTGVRYDGTKYFVSITFENEYAPTGSAEVIIDIQKELKDPAATGRGAADFEFSLYDKIKGQTYYVNSDSLGQAEFRLIYEPKDIGKTFLYILRETEDPAMVKKGYTFDPAVYVYQMTVGQNEDGTVAVTVEMRKFPSIDDVPYTINFTEEEQQEPKPAETPSIESVDTQEEQPTEETQAEESQPVEEQPAEETVSRRERIRSGIRDALESIYELVTTGRISPEKIPEEVQQAVPDELEQLFKDPQPEENPPEEPEESQPEPEQPAVVDESVTVEERQNLALFTNTYQPKMATLPLDGTKTLTGRTLEAGEFTFLIFETDDTYAIPEGAEPIRRTTNTEEGAFDFLDLELTTCGWHHFIVKEDQSQKEPGIVYDNSEYRISVLVEDIGGELSAQKVNISGKANDILFENRYEPAGTKLTITGQKILLGRELKAGEFRFNLYRANQGFTRIGDPVKTVNGLDASKVGGFRFEIAYEKEQIGTYHYVITEEPGTETDMIYDTGEYGIEVTVTDNKEGQLLAQITRLVRLGEYNIDADEIIFLNAYTGSEKPTDPDETTKPTETTKPSDSGKLPQTGQLWWPVPVLLMLGIGLILVDMLRRRGNKHER